MVSVEKVMINFNVNNVLIIKNYIQINLIMFPNAYYVQQIVLIVKVQTTMIVSYVIINIILPINLHQDYVYLVIKIVLNV